MGAGLDVVIGQLSDPIEFCLTTSKCEGSDVGIGCTCWSGGRMLELFKTIS